MIYISTTTVQGFIYYFGIFYLKIGKFYTFFQLGKGPIMGPKISPGKSLEWPSLEDRRVKSSLTFFYKIHSGTVSLDKDRYLTSAPNLRSTRASHDSQYTRYMAYSDALKNSFFPRTIPLWNSLPSSVVSSKTAEEFKALI